ncbi:MAG: hypothetical protein U0271_06320 [Polyangiaceae bacterium]
MSMECPKCGRRSWGARCDCGFQLLPESLPARSSPAPLALEIDASRNPPPPTHVPMAMSGVLGAVVRRRPPASSLAPLSIERPWQRRGAAWGLFGAALIAAAFGPRTTPTWRSALLVFGVSMVYAGFTYLVNRTEVAIRGGRLLVLRGPLPVPGNRNLAVDDVVQIFVRTTFHSRRKYPGWRYSPRVEYMLYHVCADLADGATVKLIGDFEQVDDARSIEQTLEAHIGITDDPTRSLSERRA